MNFGTIKDIFASQLIESHLSGDESGKKLYKEFVKRLSENEVLKSQFIVYKNIENKHFESEVNASDYLKENISVLKKYGIDKIQQANTKLLELLKEFNVPVESETYKELHNCLHILVTEDKNASNINKLHESFNTVKDWLMTEKEEEGKSKYVTEGVDPKKFLEIVTEKYNEKYSELSEEDKEVIKTLREGNKDSIESLMKKLVKENVNIINEHLKNYGDNLEVKQRLLEAKDVIYEMVDNNDSFGDKILKLVELKHSLT